MFDLPPIRVRATEHQLITRRCGCGTSTCAAGVAAPVQYGPQIAVIVVYLTVRLCSVSGLPNACTTTAFTAVSLSWDRSGIASGR
jgi:hypothetical protein